MKRKLDEVGERWKDLEAAQEQELKLEKLKKELAWSQAEQAEEVIISLFFFLILFAFSMMHLYLI